MITQWLIESALQLTGKSMEDMYHFEDIEIWKQDYKTVFSYPKFFYYLLSETFMDKYPWDINEYISDIPYAIMHYQKWNPEFIISLLKKIW